MPKIISVCFRGADAIQELFPPTLVEYLRLLRSLALEVFLLVMVLLCDEF